MNEIVTMSKSQLWHISDEIYHLKDYQAQYTRKGLQLRDNNTGEDYLFAYNKTFAEILGEKDFMLSEKDNKAFIHWTKFNSDAAKRNRFILKKCVKTGDTFNIDGYPFNREQITPLIDLLIEEREILIPFLLEYIRRFAEYRNIDDGGDVTVNKPKKTKPRLVQKDGSTTGVEQEMLQDTKINTKTQKEGKEMTSKITNIASTTMDINKDAVKLAAKLEVGKVATAQLKKIVKPKLPMMVRGYADSPLFDIVLANAVGIALREYAQGNEKAQIVSEAMIQSAAVEMVSSFNINDMVNEMLENIDVSKITTLDKAES